MTLSDFTPQTPLADLIAADVSAASPDELLALSSLLIDLGGDAGSKAALARAETVLDALDALDAPPLQARGHYNRSNIWSYRRHWEAQDGAWIWSSPALEAELIKLRRAIAHPGFAFHPPLAKAQVFTNLGNSLNHIGRSVEAIEAWDRALGQKMESPPRGPCEQTAARGDRRSVRSLLAILERPNDGHEVACQNFRR